MSNADPGDVFDGGGHPFLVAQKKKELAAAGAKVFITSADTSVQSKFGEEVRYTIAVKEDGETVLYTLSFSSNPIRVRQAQDILKLFAGGATTVGPLYLVQVPTKSGNKAWALSRHPMDGAVEDIGDGDADVPASAVTTPTVSVPADDQIPF